ncbi:MAG: thiamine-phosphate pyrophosphorylase [Parasphingorhabdus sp.]|jgi:thiamine-phosphate pyrophosphorylase|uniref:thiamine phosphate synthase n=1 Tax=Parasphingorhabdus sp. TaxID=2709688 RepID=UPI0039E62418|tara:strand:+ start:2223 stop:2798 length:576 start_codon:yes stop_codon:yes gene_type:complete
MLRDQPCSLLPNPKNSALPRIWLFTDERNEAVLEQAILRLPRGSGIIFRHYHLPEPVRRARFATVKKLARQRGHMLLLAGSPALARRWRADGVHGRMARRADIGGLLHSVPVHDAQEIQQANRSGADIFFLSPIFATRSHPGQRPLNLVQTRRLAALCKGAVIYLGGMDRQRYRRRRNPMTHGWAAIDAFC